LSDFNVHTRQKTISTATSDASIYDVCILGGGITGAGIARESALRGLKTLLLEKNDFAFGTSSRSSKLIHGGVRYLENFEFALVFESTQERALLWKNAPQLCHPIPFLFPTFKESKLPLWKLNLGLWLYDILATFKTPSRHRKYSAKKTIAVEPKLRSKDLVGSIFYWDGATNDARLTLANIIEAKNSGADVLSRFEITYTQYEPEKKLHKISALDHLSGKTHTFYSKTIVCAAGPWSDQALSQLGIKRKAKLLATTRGSHFVVKREHLPLNHAVVVVHPKDERVMFAIPWGDHTVVGTTDIFDECSPDVVHMNAEEVDYLIDAIKDYFPEAAFKRSDILSVWSGLRPLIRPSDEESASEISREHHLEWLDPGLLVIAGGKLTTFRKMSEDAVLKLLEKSKESGIHFETLKKASTKHLPIAPLAFPQEKRQGNIGESEAGRLSPKDIVGICQDQMVLTLEDFMVRRTDLYYKEPNNGLDLLEKLKNDMMESLDWNEANWTKQVSSYRQFVEIQNSCLK